MLTRGLMTKTLAPENSQWIAGLGLAVLLFAVLFFVIVGTTWPVGQTINTSNLIPQIGTELVTTYVLPFEAASLLLLAVLIGAIVIARE
jgi:NADH:ubiquinone oxidoreductase subunit 6 (subunit J)